MIVLYIEDDCEANYFWKPLVVVETEAEAKEWAKQNEVSKESNLRTQGVPLVETTSLGFTVKTIHFSVLRGQLEADEQKYKMAPLVPGEKLTLPHHYDVGVASA